MARRGALLAGSALQAAGEKSCLNTFFFGMGSAAALRNAGSSAQFLAQKLLPLEFLCIEVSSLLHAARLRGRGTIQSNSS